MSYQTEETIPMVLGGDVAPKISKKQSYGLAAIMILCLAVTSFMAGHAYNSASSAASVMNSHAGWTNAESCGRWFSAIYSKGGKDAGDCVAEIWKNGGGNYDSCSAVAPNCAWEISIINMQC